MSDRCDLARGWLLKAHSDLHACHLTLEADGPYDTTCFHAQQAIEKSLKALLAYHGQLVPRTHDLEELQRLCSALQVLPGLDDYDFAETTDYGVLVRYDLEFWPEQDTADEAVVQAEQVFGLVASTLPSECRP
jgi:HEPN domain-containing protein